MLLKSLLLVALLGAGAPVFGQEKAPASQGLPAAALPPYSADEKTELIRPLPDGARAATIRSTARIYRDSKGRVRREVSFPDPAGGNSNRLAITISDGVAGARYELDPAARTAFSEPLDSSAAVRGREGERRESGYRGEGEPRAGQGGGEGERREGGRGGEGEHREEKRGREGERRAGGEGKGGGDRGGGGQNPRARQHQDLGFKMIEGLKAHGSRNTFAGGASAEDRADVVTDERWVAVELGIVVKSIHSDPRTGDTVLTLTNIKRDEPEASLFQIPPCYTLKQPTSVK